MSTTKRPPDIRTSYTRIERALLAAYLGYPDPAPPLQGVMATSSFTPLASACRLLALAWAGGDQSFFEPDSAD